MLYFIVKPFATLTLKVFFRKIYIGNIENIPLDKPVIFVCNHPTAFLEPCLLACILPRALHFMVRGNLFKNKYLNQILFSLHLIPIYRVDDPMEKRRDNRNVLNTCFKYLQQKKAILIMGEGHTNIAKRLRPMKKGPARLAFGALNYDPAIDVQIVPIGVNFTKSDEFRSEVYFNCGKPISLNAYKPAFYDHPTKGMLRFTKDLGVAMEKNVIDIKDPKDDAVTEQAMEIYRNNLLPPAFPVLVRDNKRLFDQKRINHHINQLPVMEKNALKNRFEAYFKALAEKGVKDEGLAGNFNMLYFLLLMPGGVLFLLGFIMNCPPLFLSLYITRTKVKSAEYKGPMKVGLALAGYLVYYLLLLGLFAASPLPWWYVFLIPIVGYLAVLWWDVFRRQFYAQKAAGAERGLVEERAVLAGLVNGMLGGR